MADKPDPRSGVGEEGQWSPAFPGQRPPFEPGHDLARRHGAYVSVLKLAPRAEEVAEAIRELMGPIYSQRFELAIQAAAPTLVRYERAMVALLEADDPGDFQRLDESARSWARIVFSALDKLGLTPLAVSRLGLNLALGGDEGLRALERHVEQVYGAGEGGSE